MKTLKLLGIIAITALIIIGVTACEDPLGLLDEDKELSGQVTFKVSTYGPFTGKVLEANYSGDENVSYQWYTEGSKVNGATNATFTPPAWDTSGTKKSGNVQVEVIAAGYESKKWSKVIYAAPEWVNFYGVWKMEGSKNGNWKPTGASTVTDETMVIKFVDTDDTSFKLTSTYDSEFLQFTITAWEAVTLSSQWSGYSKGYKLTFSTDAAKGYDSKGYNTAKTHIYYLLYKEDSGEMIIDRWFQSGPTAGYEVFAQSGTTPRSFVRDTYTSPY